MSNMARDAGGMGNFQDTKGGPLTDTVFSAGFLDSLPDPDRKAFRAISHPRRYRCGAVMFGEGDTSDWVALLLTGRVKLSSFTQDGREAVIGIAGHGELLGELSAVDGEPRSATAIAIDPVDALVVSADDFTRFL